MLTVQDALNELDDLKSLLYTVEEEGGLDSNTNAQVQELLREAYRLLEG